MKIKIITNCSTLIVVAILLLTSCKKDIQEACIKRSSTWLFSKDTVLVGDSIHFGLCNILAPSSTVCIWDFGDGTTTTGIYVAHAWDSAGSYLVKLTVPDGKPKEATVMIVVTKADGFTYAGNWQVQSSFFSDDTTYTMLPYSVSVAASSANDIVISNLLNDGNNVSAFVNGNELLIPTQIFSTDSISGSGNLTVNQQKVGLFVLKGKATGRELYSISLQR